MLSGMPDYQSIVRPKFGGALYESGFKDVTAGLATSLLEVSGKGMIYGGMVWLEAALTQANSELWLILDGIGLGNVSFWEMQKYGVKEPRSALVTLNTFDGINFIYSVGISYGITFEKKVGLTYFEVYDRIVRVHYRFVYALI